MRLSVLDNMKNLCLKIQEVANGTPIEMLAVNNKDRIQLGKNYITLSGLISEYKLMIVKNYGLGDKN